MVEWVGVFYGHMLPQCAGASDGFGAGSDTPTARGVDYAYWYDIVPGMQV